HELSSVRTKRGAVGIDRTRPEERGPPTGTGPYLKASCRQRVTYCSLFDGDAFNDLQHPGFLLRRGQERRRVTGSALRGRRCDSVKFRHLFTRENALSKGSEDDHERRAEVMRSR